MNELPETRPRELEKEGKRVAHPEQDPDPVASCHDEAKLKALLASPSASAEGGGSGGTTAVVYLHKSLS